MKYIDFKALVLGSLATAIVLLVAQLIYVLIASYVGTSANEVSWVNDHKDSIWYILSLVAFAGSFFIGGVIASLLTSDHASYHAIAIAFVINVISTLTAGDPNLLNSKAWMMLGVSVFFAWLGANWATKEKALKHRQRKELSIES